MNRGRTIAIAALFALPVALLGLAGTYAIWERGWLGRLGWVLLICWCLGYFLMRLRRPTGEDAWSVGPSPPQWTPRDEKAHDEIRRELLAAPEVPVSQLSDPHFYLKSALEVSNRVARYYHPNASDPISSLTVLEVLAAAQLAVEDSTNWFRDNVPGSHLVTIRYWRALSHAPRLARIVSDATWLVSLWWNPVNLPRWLASKYASTSATTQIEESLLAAFHHAFQQYVLLHCIEMNSGRLRGGVTRHRTALSELRDPGQRQPASQSESQATGRDDEQRRSSREPFDMDSARPTANEPSMVRIAIVGQVNAGKSSLINSLRGEHHAKCDVVAATDAIQRYRFTVPGSGEQLELLDTPGYGSAELTAQQKTAIQNAWSQADLALLVMDVTSPARQADWRLVNELSNWYIERPRFKPPPVIGVLTHIDGLSPAMEWQPPYDWRNPVRPKERTIRAALDYTESLFGDAFAAVIPVCSDAARGRTHGVEEWLIPAVLASLSEAKAALVVRSLHDDVDAERMRQLVRQLRGAGGKLLKVLFDLRTESRPATADADD